MKLSSRVLIGIAFLSAIFGLSAAFYYLHQQSYVDEIVFDESKVESLINKFRNSNKAIDKALFPINYKNTFPRELLDPQNILPDPSRYNAIEMAEILRLGRECLVDDLAKLKTTLNEHQYKFVLWYEYKCGKRSNLDNTVWRNPPFIHPLGGTWAHWVNKNGYGNANWLGAEKKYLHVLEYRYVPVKMLEISERMYAVMTPNNLELLVTGSGIIATPTHVLITAVYTLDENIMDIYPRAIWDNYLKENNLLMTASAGHGCRMLNRSYCWGVNIKKWKKINSQYFIFGMLVLVGVLAGALAYSVWRSAKEEKEFIDKQQLVMQTMAHELRHPVTGLRLFIEAVRPSYDELPEDIKSDFLRAANISSRMSRLVKFSQQYLQLLSKDRQFEFRKEEIESVNNFLESSLRDYAGKITIQTVNSDIGCAMDGYWVSTCVTNLVVNALTHGKMPIVVSWERNQRNLHIHVADAGSGPPDPLNKLTKPLTKRSKAGGMGLGLSLVNRIANLMNGSLTLKKNPTTFTFTLKGVCRD